MMNQSSISTHEGTFIQRHTIQSRKYKCQYAIPVSAEVIYLLVSVSYKQRDLENSSYHPMCTK